MYSPSATGGPSRRTSANSSAMAARLCERVRARPKRGASAGLVVRALGLLLLDTDRFLADLRLSGALALEPLGALLLEGVDLLGGEGLGEAAAGEAGDGHAQFRGDDRARVG